MSTSNLIAEALNDAKALRETAIENAKAALNESFVPRMQAMIGQKLREETAPEEDAEVLPNGDEAGELPPADDSAEAPVEDGDPVADAAAEAPEAEVAEPAETEESGEIEEPAAEGDAADVASLSAEIAELKNKIDQLTAAVTGEEAGDAEEVEIVDDENAEGAGEDVGEIEGSAENVGDETLEQPSEGEPESTEDEEVNINEILNELEEEMVNEGNMVSGESPKAKCEKAECDEKVVKKPTASAQEDKKHFATKTFKESVGNRVKSVAESVDDPSGNKEDLNLDEILSEMENEEDGPDETCIDPTGKDKCDPDGLTLENATLKKELKEYRKAVLLLKSKLNEVNLLNAKLLYTNRIFKNYNLTNSQKMKIVESFDLSKDVRDVKLTYTVLKESLTIGTKHNEQSKVVSKPTQSPARKAIVEGLASKAVGSTKPLNESKLAVIPSEESALASRFQKLAGINQNN